MKKFFSAAVLGFVLLPSTALALPGVGPRVTIEGEVTAVTISEQQLFDDKGAELTVIASNGQIVNIVLKTSTRIVSEGRLSTKKILPRDLRKGMHVRVTGRRLGTDGIDVSLLVITNVEANPGLSGNGIISSFDNNIVTLQGTDGAAVSYTVDEDTEIAVSYTVKGPSGMSLVGMQAVYSVSPSDPTRLKVLRITGEPDKKKAIRPSARELRTVPIRSRR